MSFSSSSNPQQPLLQHWSVFPKSLAIGGVAGVCGSLAGMGGGFIMIPLMTSRLLKLTQHQAHGTSLCAVMATGLAGAISYGDHVQIESATAIAVCGMVSARLGALATRYMSEKRLRTLLGVLMLVMAPIIPLKTYVLEQYQSSSNEDVKVERLETENNEAADLITRWKTDPSQLVIPSCIGMFSGFLAGVFGVGGGVIVVPALTLALDLNHYQALGTSLAAMTPPAAVGVYTHFAAGNVALRVAPALAAGAWVGAYMGGKLGQHTDQTTLRWGFTGVLTVLGLRTLAKA